MPVVSGPFFAEAAYSYAGRGLTYQNYDCTHFTNLVRRTCGLSNLSQGSNAMWRSSAMLWKGSVAEARQKYGQLLPGMYMFHVIPDDDPAADHRFLNGSFLFLLNTLQKVRQIRECILWRRDQTLPNILKVYSP